jgi:DNA polymerase
MQPVENLPSSLEPSWAELRRKVASIGCAEGLGPVFGDGDPTARLVLVGEAPGATEASLGRPFVGAAGRILERLLQRAGLSREELWVTNVVKCRPVRASDGHLLNRAPSVSEIRTWWPVLEEELRLIAPRAVVCLGAVAASALIGAKFRLTEDRGRVFSTPLAEVVIGTFHPAYLLRLRGPQREEALAAAEADLRLAGKAAHSPSGGSELRARTSGSEL